MRCLKGDWELRGLDSWNPAGGGGLRGAGLREFRPQVGARSAQLLPAALEASEGGKAEITHCPTLAFIFVVGEMKA